MIMFRAWPNTGEHIIPHIVTVNGAILVARDETEASRAPAGWERVPYPPDTITVEEWKRDT